MLNHSFNCAPLAIELIYIAEKQNTLMTMNFGTYFFNFGILHSKSVILLVLCLVFVVFYPFSSVVLKLNVQLSWNIIIIHFSEYLCVP